jgi:hypothetical protein
MDFVVLNQMLTTLSFITPFMLYSGMIFVLSVDKRLCELCDQYLHSLTLRFKEDLLFKRFLDRLHVGDHKYHTKSASNLFHHINNHR